MNYITTAALAALGAVLMGWLPLTPLMGSEDTQDLQRQARFEKAAIELCGPGAAASEIEKHVVLCVLHNGKKVAIK